MNENSAWLQEQRRTAQLEAERRYAHEPKPPAAGEADETRDPNRRDRVQRTCSICRAAGLVDEAKGHIAIGHDTWLAQQPAHLQAHFKGQGGPSDLEPRLVKPPVAETPHGPAIPEPTPSSSH